MTTRRCGRRWRAGFTILSLQAAGDCDLALSCILQRPPAAMILDYQIYRVDRICLLARLRQLEVTVSVTGALEQAQADI